MVLPCSLLNPPSLPLHCFAGSQLMLSFKNRKLLEKSPKIMWTVRSFAFEGWSGQAGNWGDWKVNFSQPKSGPSPSLYKYSSILQFGQGILGV